jgi:hypothetical protein
VFSSRFVAKSYSELSSDRSVVVVTMFKFALNPITNQNCVYIHSMRGRYSEHFLKNYGKSRNRHWGLLILRQYSRLGSSEYDAGIPIIQSHISIPCSERQNMNLKCLVTKLPTNACSPTWETRSELTFRIILMHMDLYLHLHDIASWAQCRSSRSAGYNTRMVGARTNMHYYWGNLMETGCFETLNEIEAQL